MLVRVAARHKSETGTRLFEKGQSARKARNLPQALELFRAAYNSAPGNASYELAFAQALTDAGRLRDGQAVLIRLLSKQPALGPANIEMARVLAKEGDWQRSAWYYHRGIYGEWQGPADLRSLRFELADLLAQRGDREQLVSEIVLLATEPVSGSEARHLARLQLAAEEWDRAEQLYRSLIRTDAEDRELLAGLARAEMRLGRYIAAEHNFRRAIAAGAEGGTVKSDLEMVSQANAMNPTLRRLTVIEKHRRAHELASALLAGLSACSEGQPNLSASISELASHARVRNFTELAETDLEVFEHLWMQRSQLCKGGVDLPGPVVLLATQLAK